jgi:GNAT superfamily N-acetyltransferase
MDIIPLDRDDDVMVKSLYGIASRVDAVSRVHPVQRTAEEFAAWLRFDFPGERMEAAVVVVDGSPVGWSQLYFPERENLDKCWTELRVDPEHRGNGYGSALLDWSETQARAGDRSMLLAEVHVPQGARESHADRVFAERRGYRVASTEIVRSLPLPVDADLLARERRRAAEAMGEAYEVRVFTGGVPQELRQGVCDASNRLILDAPTGDVDFDPESQTVEDYQTMLDHHARVGDTLLTAVALHRDTGVVAAYTDLNVPPSDPDVVHQWGTLVLPEHRGHRLGMAVKVANLDLLAESFPRRTRVQTMNDEQNPWMVQINVDLGFRITEEALSMRKDL